MKRVCFPIIIIIAFNSMVIAQNFSKTSCNNINISAKCGDSCNIIITNPSILRYMPYQFHLGFTDTSNLKLKGENVWLRKQDDNSYLMSVSDTSNLFGKINFYRIGDNGTTELGSISFAVDELPTYLGFPAIKPGAKISLKES
jgi:hypothetical protein